MSSIVSGAFERKTVLEGESMHTKLCIWKFHSWRICRRGGGLEDILWPAASWCAFVLLWTPTWPAVWGEVLCSVCRKGGLFSQVIPVFPNPPSACHPSKSQNPL
jgi:hypothetical protein